MLSKIHHGHIVSLLGYCEESGTREMILVYEYMPNGSLDDHLHKRRTNNSKSSSSTLTWVQRLNICIGAARGLDYLHTGTSVQIRVIHRDIKSSNILLDENWAAKISDFGVSRTSPAYQPGTTTNVFTRQIIGTFGYLDAEYFSTHRVTRKSDVYAFGVVLLEVLCGRPALDFTLEERQHSLAGWGKQCIREGNTGRIMDPCLRGQAPSNCFKEFGQIAYECLRCCSKDRPTMTKVLARLEYVLAWTLRSVQSASDRKHIGKAVLIEKAWSLFSIKAPMRMSPDTNKLGQNDGKKKKGLKMEKHVVDTGDVATACQQVVPPSRSLFSIKAPMRMNPVINKLGQNDGKKKKGLKMEKHVVDSGGVKTARQQVVPPTREKMEHVLKEFTYSELRIATRNFRRDTLVGEGGFGRVYKGWLDSVTIEPPEVGVKIEVAIKRSKLESVQGLKEWQAEMIFLGSLRHQNLVKLFGYCWEDRVYFLVYEYMQKGSLENHLFTKSAEPLPWFTRIKIAIGAAQGLAFLHKPENNVICRDMKSSNILLDEEFNAKLSDFGLAHKGADYGETHVSTRVVGTYGYLAPEYIVTGRVSIRSDVYAFGMVMLEIITGLRAFDRGRPAKEHDLLDLARPFLSGKKKLQTIIDPRLLHDYPLKGACKIVELIGNCLEKDPNIRPSMEEVVSCLQGISAIEMKPTRSKSKDTMSKYGHRWSHVGTSGSKGAWSTSSWVSGFKGLIGSKKEKNRTRTEIWEN